MDFTANIVVTLKQSVLDPQGSTVMEALHHMGYSDVNDVRMGKFMELNVSAKSKKSAEEQVDEICKKLLVNPVIETYTVEFKKSSSRGEK